MKTMKCLSAIMALLLVFPVLAYTYGDGAAVGAVTPGLDSGEICRCETLDEVRQGQRWPTRPEAMKKTAYEFLSSFSDAERNLLDSYDTGNFTKEEVKDILQWLRDNRMYMSDKALAVLNTLTGPSKGAATKHTKTASTGKSTQTTAAVAVTKPKPGTPKKVLKQSIAWKHMAFYIAKETVRKAYVGLKEQYPDKNEFAIQDLLYRKIFTKEERNLIESDLKNHLATRALLNEATK